MTKEDFTFLMQVRLMKDDNINGLYEEFKVQSWSFRAFEKHVQLRKYKLDKRAFVFIFYVSESAIGKMVKMLEKVDNWNKMANQNIVTFDHCAMNVFPDLKIKPQKQE